MYVITYSGTRMLKEQVLVRPTKRQSGVHVSAHDKHDLSRSPTSHPLQDDRERDRDHLFKDRFTINKSFAPFRGLSGDNVSPLWYLHCCCAFCCGFDCVDENVRCVTCGLSLRVILIGS
mmetsp:Transcript_15950/g.36667  ORF Transcript_15950/g.36667 Transcript_15950/m.36667 type:complete len:119 (+) Transcript_15950:165-521(+)